MAKKMKEKKLSKEAILNEAKRLFSIKGYKGTTLEDLTKVFGVSRPSIYYYYKSKMEILSELHITGFNDAINNFDRILASDLPTKEKFRKILENHIHNLATDTKAPKIFYFDEMEMPLKLRKEIIKRRKAYINKIIAVYKSGVEEGIFKKMDSKLAVYLIIGACNWIPMWYSPEKSITPEEIVNNLMVLLTGGYENIRN